MGEQIEDQFRKVHNAFLLGVNKHLDSRKFCLCLGILLVKQFLDLKKKSSLQECKLYLKWRDNFSGKDFL